MLGKTIKSLITPSNLQKILSSSVITHNIRNITNVSLLRSNSFQTLTPKNLPDVDIQDQIPISSSEIPSNVKDQNTLENPLLKKYGRVVDRFHDLVINFEYVDPPSDQHIFKANLYKNIVLCEKMANVDNKDYKDTVKRYLLDEKEIVESYIKINNEEFDASVVVTMIPMGLTAFCYAYDATTLFLTICGISTIAMISYGSRLSKRQRNAKINNEFIRKYISML
jgi:hypothetical protein